VNPLEARFFPFYRLGLRRNPFGSLTAEEWQSVTVMPPMVADLMQQDCRYFQFTGDSGRGKTTLLLAVRQYFLRQGENIPFEKIVEGQHRFSTSLTGLHGLALDEAQRLRWFERRRLFRQIGDRRLLITTHEDLSSWFRRYGMAVTAFSAETGSTREHLAQVLERRLSYFAHGDAPGISFSPEAVDYLWQVYGNNLRGIEYFLYEVFQGISEPGIITAKMLATAAK
jgi:hypothetical protein